MTKEDLPRVTDPAIQFGYVNSLEDPERRFERLSKLPQYGFYVAKLEGGEDVGWVQVSEEAESLLVEPMVEIAALVVDEKCRSQGIGAKLVQRAEEWAVSRGFKSMRVRSNIKREAAHRFYRRSGYTLTKTGHYFTKECLGEAAGSRRAVYLRASADGNSERGPSLRAKPRVSTTSKGCLAAQRVTGPAGADP